VPDFADLVDNFGKLSPRTLQEALGMMARIQAEQKHALMQGDLKQLNRLLDAQAIAWSHVKAAAMYLIEQGGVPQDLDRRLQEVLQAHDATLQAARRLGERMGEQLLAARHAATAACKYHPEAA